MVTNLELEQKHRAICDDARRLALKRGTQYAKDDDTLLTFRQVALLEGRKPSQVCQTLIGVKICRLMNQLKNNEDVSDTVVDLVNYEVYLLILQKEEKYEDSIGPAVKNFKITWENGRVTSSEIDQENLLRKLQGEQVE